MQSSFKIVFTDTNPILSEGLCRLVGADPLLVTTSHPVCGAEDLATLVDLTPDIVVIDPTQTDLTPAALIAGCAAAAEPIALIGYLDGEKLDLARDCMVAGFAAVIAKTAPVLKLDHSLRVVADGGVYLDRVFAQFLTDFQPAGDSPEPSQSGLTPQERRVLHAIAMGTTLKMIAAEMELSTKTVDTYKTRGAGKLNLKTRAEIVAYALHAGWMQTQQPG